MRRESRAPDIGMPVEVAGTGHEQIPLAVVVPHPGGQVERFQHRQRILGKHADGPVVRLEHGQPEPVIAFRAEILLDSLDAEGEPVRHLAQIAAMADLPGGAVVGLLDLL